VTHWDTSLPSVLSELHKLEFDFADGEGIDFEPFATFMSAEETASWIEAWTGNPEANGNQLRVFGQDGTGGYAAFWLVDANKNTLEQPIVFFGSEGDRGVVAANFNDYLWLLAGGIGPMEAVYFPGLKREPNSTFLEFAEKHATGSRLAPQEIVAKANGADHTILYKDEDFVAKVKEITGGKLCDVVYDGVGKTTFPASLDCLRPLGYFVSFGSASGQIDAFNINILQTKGSLFATRPTLNNYVAKRDDLIATAADLFKVVGSGAVKIPINQKYSLKDAAKAHKEMEGRDTTGSSILLP